MAVKFGDEGENATLDADGTFNDGGNGDDVDAGDDVALFTGPTHCSAVDEVVSVNEDDSSDYDIAGSTDSHTICNITIIY